jgi:hypothetical protein
MVYLSSENLEELLYALLITHLPAGRQGFQEMITQVSWISEVLFISVVHF